MKVDDADVVFARRLSRRFIRRAEPFTSPDELEAAALLALISASSNFDPLLGSFRTLLVEHVRGHCLSEIRTNFPAGRKTGRKTYVVGIGGEGTPLDSIEARGDPQPRDAAEFISKVARVFGRATAWAVWQRAFGGMGVGEVSSALGMTTEGLAWHFDRLRRCPWILTDLEL